MHDNSTKGKKETVIVFVTDRVRSYVLTRVCPSINLSVHTWGGGGGGTPARSSWVGYPDRGVPHLGYPPQSDLADGGVPHLRYPPGQTWLGGTPPRVPPPVRPAWGGTPAGGYPTSSST